MMAGTLQGRFLLLRNAILSLNCCLQLLLDLCLLLTCWTLLAHNFPCLVSPLLHVAWHVAICFVLFSPVCLLSIPCLTCCPLLLTNIPQCSVCPEHRHRLMLPSVSCCRLFPDVY